MVFLEFSGNNPDSISMNELSVELPAGMRRMTDDERKEQANMVLEALEKQACSWHVGMHVQEMLQLHVLCTN
jgi:hypothetical protein